MKKFTLFCVPQKSREEWSSLILTDIIARPLFCPYYTTSAKYGAN